MLMYRKFLAEAARAMDPSSVEFCQFLFNEEDEWNEYDEAGDKEGVYKENYYLRDNFQKPIIAPVLSKQANRDKIVDFIGQFMDEHSEQLSTSGPVYSFTFGQKEVSFLYELFKTDKNKMLELYDNLIKETYFGSISQFITGWVTNAPHKMLLMGMLVEAVQKNYEDIIECCEYMWAFTEYPIIYGEFWPNRVREDVMNYTIEHLGNKFVIKHMSNLKGLLKYDTTKVVEFFTPLMKEGVDNVYIDFMRRMRKQMYSKIQNIASEYYKNIKDNASQHQNVSQFDDGELADQEGHTTIVARAVEHTIDRITVEEVNGAIIKMAAFKGIDKGNLSGMIAQINATKNNRIHQFIETVITAYFERNPSSSELGSAEFLNFGLGLYKSISTSKNQLYIKLREIMDYWMFTIIDIRSQYGREATIINYTKAVFNYFVILIAHYN